MSNEIRPYLPLWRASLLALGRVAAKKICERLATSDPQALTGQTGQTGDRRREKRKCGTTIDLDYLYATLEAQSGSSEHSSRPS